MKCHRFFVENTCTYGEVVIDTPRVVRQLRTVLRAKKGMYFQVIDAHAKEWRIKITNISPNNITGVCLEQLPPLQFSPRHTLRISLLRAGNFDVVVEKAVELGIKVISPLITRRVVKGKVNMARTYAIAQEAAEQCGRREIPTILSPMTLEEALQTPINENRAGFCVGDFPLFNGAPKEWELFIGPEGGWSDEEVELLKSHTVLFSLGPLTLRAETAAIVALGRTL